MVGSVPVWRTWGLGLGIIVAVKFLRKTSATRKMAIGERGRKETSFQPCQPAEHKLKLWRTNCVP